MRHWRLYAYIIPFRTVVGALVLAVNIIHPLIHGTPLDGGVLDGLITQLDTFALGVSQCDDHNHYGGSE